MAESKRKSMALQGWKRYVARLLPDGSRWFFSFDVFLLTVLSQEKPACNFEGKILTYNRKIWAFLC